MTRGAALLRQIKSEPGIGTQALYDRHPGPESRHTVLLWLRMLEAQGRIARFNKGWWAKGAAPNDPAVFLRWLRNNGGATTRTVALRAGLGTVAAQFLADLHERGLVSYRAGWWIKGKAPKGYARPRKA